MDKRIGVRNKTYDSKGDKGGFRHNMGVQEKPVPPLGERGGPGGIRTLDQQVPPIRLMSFDIRILSL